MEIRSILEHENLIAVDNTEISEHFIEKLSHQHHVMLVCDVSENISDNDRVEYIKSLAAAGIINEANVSKIVADKSLIIIAPFLTQGVANEEYRRIKHAQHFVTMYVDGEAQTTC